MVSAKKLQAGIILTLAVLLVLMYTGCGSDDKKSGLVGKWDYNSAEGSTPFDDFVVIFNGDGTGRAIMNEGSEDEDITNFTWSVSGDQLTITTDLGGTQTTTYTISGNTLTLNWGEYTEQYTRA